MAKVKMVLVRCKREWEDGNPCAKTEGHVHTCIKVLSVPQNEYGVRSNEGDESVASYVRGECGKHACACEATLVEEMTPVNRV